MLIIVSLSTWIHFPTYRNTTYTPWFPQVLAPPTHQTPPARDREENVSKAGQNPTSDTVIGLMAICNPDRTNQNAPKMEVKKRSLPVGSWEFGLELRTAIFLLTLRWPVWEINIIPEKNIGKDALLQMESYLNGLSFRQVSWVYQKLQNYTTRDAPKTSLTL